MILPRNDSGLSLSRFQTILYRNDWMLIADFEVLSSISYNDILESSIISSVMLCWSRKCRFEYTFYFISSTKKITMFLCLGWDLSRSAHERSLFSGRNWRLKRKKVSGISHAADWQMQRSFPYRFEPFSSNISFHSLKAFPGPRSCPSMASNLQFK